MAALIQNTKLKVSPEIVQSPNGDIKPEATSLIAGIVTFHPINRKAKANAPRSKLDVIRNAMKMTSETLTISTTKIQPPVAPRNKVEVRLNAMKLAGIKQPFRLPNQANLVSSKIDVKRNAMKLVGEPLQIPVAPAARTPRSKKEVKLNAMKMSGELPTHYMPDQMDVERFVSIQYGSNKSDPTR